MKQVPTVDGVAGWELNKSGKKIAYPDFFPQAQRDFAARLKWSVTATYKNANHEPVAKIEGPLDILASAGEKIRINGNISDPDGNAVSISWWQLQVGSYPNKVNISNPNPARAEVLIPNDAMGGQTIHLILEASRQWNAFTYKLSAGNYYSKR